MQPTSQAGRAATWVDVASLLLRVGVGSVFLLSGLEKLLRGNDWVVDYFQHLGVGAAELVAPAVTLLEVVGGCLLIAGLLTRVVALLFVLEMAAVLVLVRAPAAAYAASLLDAFDGVRFELLLLVAACSVVLLGPGRWSLDALVRRARRPT